MKFYIKLYGILLALFFSGIAHAANDFFTASGNPTTGASLSSATMRTEFATIEDGFDKMPTMTGNPNEYIKVNAGATALEAVPISTIAGAHNIEDHNATAATGPELSTLTDGSDSATLHHHASLGADVDMNGYALEYDAATYPEFKINATNIALYKSATEYAWVNVNGLNWTTSAGGYAANPGGLILYDGAVSKAYYKVMDGSFNATLQADGDITVTPGGSNIITGTNVISYDSGGGVTTPGLQFGATSWSAYVNSTDKLLMGTNGLFQYHNDLSTGKGINFMHGGVNKGNLLYTSAGNGTLQADGTLTLNPTGALSLTADTTVTGDFGISGGALSTEIYTAGNMLEYDNGDGGYVDLNAADLTIGESDSGAYFKINESGDDDVYAMYASAGQDAKLSFLADNSAEAGTITVNDTGEMVISCDDDVTIANGNLRPNANNTLDNGENGYRWNDLFATDVNYVNLVSISDERLKKNVKNLGSADVDFLYDLVPVSYKYKDEENGKETRYGFVAQSAETNVPADSVFVKKKLKDKKNGNINNPDDYYYAMSNTELIAPMLKLIQEQKAMIDSLESRVVSLEARVDILETP